MKEFFIVIAEFIQQVGFPIAVACYMMWFAHSTIKNNTSAIESLKDAITSLCEKVTK